MHYSEEDTDKVARALLQEIVPHTDKATILALEGDLGAGKTTLTKSLGKLLGVQETIVSPTFVIAKFYQTTHHEFKTLVHIDAYRIESDDELDPIKFSSIISTPDTLVVIEWPERISTIPDTAYRYRVTHVGDARHIQKL
jgi:tRNA threonylcarbamoyladenosine biosynthesis protein TsaE